MGPFSCSYCKMVFFSNVNLQRHDNKHFKATKSYKCEKWGKEFSMKIDLNRHTKNYDINAMSVINLSSHRLYWRITRKFTLRERVNTRAIFAGKCFKSNLYRHRKIHDEDNYICGICGTIFDTKKYLKDHLGTHDESLQYKCKHCLKAFKTKKYLRQHMKRVHY